MELEQILKLIDAVSKSALTGFSLEEGETKLTLTAERVKRIQPGTADRRAGYTVRLYAGITGRKPVRCFRGKNAEHDDRKSGSHGRIQLYGGGR